MIPSTAPAGPAAPQPPAHPVGFASMMGAMHPLREALHNEVHARPTEPMNAPLMLSHVANVGGNPSDIRRHLHTLLANRHLPVPSDTDSYITADIGGVHLRWEQHTEFHTYTFSRALARDFNSSPGDSALPIAAAPQNWLRDLPGLWLVGMHVMVVLKDAARAAPPVAVRQWLDPDTLVASAVFQGAATVYTDFRLHADGFGRWVIAVGSLEGLQLGRLVQCVLEIETYRMMALLGLPAAREVSRALATAERDLADVAQHIQNAKADDESDLLRQLTRLAAQVEGLHAQTHARFSASTAYFELVQQRIEELGESPIPGLKTLGQFMERRLHPAMQTCQWAARRQQALSERISRVSDMLRTRVDIAQQQSSQALLDTMNRRQQAQLLLQAAVESLSVAAVTYYGVGLVGYIVKGIHAAGVPIAAEPIAALAVPVIALGVWFGVRRRLHHRVQDAAQ